MTDIDWASQAEEWGDRADRRLRDLLDHPGPTNEMNWVVVRAVQAQAQFCATMAVRDRLYQLSLPPDERYT
ncbi:hypothetical protein [Nocardia sp. CC201C]|uniref:hypothetical protein n=1 Tax=Nocardia sp. CC201C TaxID=3044575 RepID=UPI0024A8A616|nr:hypothetical protein [Nocardia sp. CC201C]